MNSLHDKIMSRCLVSEITLEWITSTATFWYFRVSIWFVPHKDTVSKRFYNK